LRRRVSSKKELPPEGRRPQGSTKVSGERRDGVCAEVMGRKRFSGTKNILKKKSGTVGKKEQLEEWLEFTVMFLRNTKKRK